MDRDTRIIRAGKPIVLSQLAVGQVAKLVDVETQQTGHAPRPHMIQAP